MSWAYHAFRAAHEFWRPEDLMESVPHVTGSPTHCPGKIRKHPASIRNPQTESNDDTTENKGIKYCPPGKRKTQPQPRTPSKQKAKTTPQKFWVCMPLNFVVTEPSFEQTHLPLTLQSKAISFWFYLRCSVDFPGGKNWIGTLFWSVEFEGEPFHKKKETRGRNPLGKWVTKWRDPVHSLGARKTKEHILAVAQKTGTKMEPCSVETWSKTCGLPLLFNFEPAMCAKLRFPDVREPPGPGRL